MAPSPDRLRQLQQLLDEMFELPAAQREARLRELHADDARMHEEIVDLLARHERITPDFMYVPESTGQVALNETTGPDPLLGIQISHFRVVRVIATGGMGTVYEAEQNAPCRTVALKVLRPGLASDYAMKHFKHESQILARLRHPHIAQVYEAGTTTIERCGGGVLPYFAMEYVEGARTLIEYAAEHGLQLNDRLELFIQACDAVHHGHQKGVIHRDLKPGNILVDDDGRVKVIDFGIARSTDADLAMTTMHNDVSELVGTLQYMSPEQCRAESTDVDIRGDVYSLEMSQ